MSYRKETRRHATDYYSAAFIVHNIIDDDMTEVSAIRVKKAYIEGYIYHFGKVSENKDEWEDARQVVKNITLMYGYYTDMKKLYND